MGEKASILFVDDEKRVLNSMRGLFRRDFELFLTTEGANAIEIAARNSIDVIVADQRMPGMTGIEVLGRVKTLSPRTVRILLTGYADPNAVEGSINIGEVFRFLSKPCHPKLLRETLDLAIAASRTAPAVTESPQEEVAQKATEAPASDVSSSSPAPAPLQQSPAAVPQQPPRATPAEPARQPQHGNATKERTAAPHEHDMGAEDPAHWRSVTEIVMSGDTSQVTRQPDFEARAAANTKDVGVVVFTIDSAFAETTMRAISVDRNTILATTLGKVAQAIEQKEAGVLITDFTTNRSVLQKMINVLKHHLPELVTIVVSDSRDTTDMISLINHGQVFRYVLKPIEPHKLRNEINAAAIHHQHLLSNPEALKRHQVIRSAEPAEASPTLEQFVGRIRSVRSQRPETTGSWRPIVED